MRRASLADSITDFRRHGRAIAIVHHRGYRMERWSYADLLDTAARSAKEPAARGIAKGERILLWGENSAEWVAAFLGCALSGVIAVPMDRGATPEFVARVEAQVNPRLAVLGREQPAAGIAAPVIVLEELRDAVAAHPAEPLPRAELTRDDALEIVFTSGTTAEPRGVVISHGNFLANLEPLETEIRKYDRYERWVHPIRFLNLLPLSHVFGQFMGIFVPPLLGGTILLLDTLNPGEVQRVIRRERVSVLVTVPRLVESLRDKIERDLEAEGRIDKFRREFDRAEHEHFLRRWWRFRCIHRRLGWKFWAFISGGAALPEAAEKFWSRLGYAGIQGYGLTETASLVTVQHPFQLAKGSIGKALPGREIKLSENGEILVRGESVAKGYWSARGGGLEPVVGDEGWFHTGDLGVADTAGNLYFKGRRKNVIVTPAGLNVYPEDLESVLRRRPEVRDAVVVGIQRDGNAEPCAVLLLREPEPAAAEGESADGLPRGKETVLLVEDSGLLRRVTAEFLKRIGYTVIDAADGMEALNLAENHRGKINLLLTDLAMPGMNGQELAQKLLARLPQLKVLYTSGYAGSLLQERDYPVLSTAFLEKPFTWQSLAQQVCTVLDHTNPDIFGKK